ncbi:hypothetical protein OG429_38615 [Streptomyces sp. NBC_00190]|uniref:hypothetical protein n=1 Tax=Streptomyces sp. NBC_00190 TaxID=2903634 RepID=UPI002E27EF33|nr:hypothetical protein [Streptomyces sp. NBC_00190]
MILRIDERWLLEIQEQQIPEESHLRDYTALVAAVARHRAELPQVGYQIDAAWLAAALAHTKTKLRPMESRNALFAAATITAYMAATGRSCSAQPGSVARLATPARRQDGRSMEDHVVLVGLPSKPFRSTALVLTSPRGRRSIEEGSNNASGQPVRAAPTVITAPSGRVWSQVPASARGAREQE